MAAGSNAGVAAAALVALLVVAAASGAAGAGYNVCGINTDRLATDCKSYCKVGSTDSQPGELCCAAAKGVQYRCLCQFKSVLPSDIDANRAMQIPSQCGVKGAPTQCY